MIKAMKWIFFSIFIFGAFASEKKVTYINDEQKHTALSLALQEGDENTARSLLSDLNEKKKVEFLMKKDEIGQTDLHHASKNGEKKVVQLLLKTFCEVSKKKKIFEYLMKEDKANYTALHFASNGHTEIVKLLVSAFKEEDKEKLIEFIIKENKYQENSLKIASLQQKKWRNLKFIME